MDLISNQPTSPPASKQGSNQATQGSQPASQLGSNQPKASSQQASQPASQPLSQLRLASSLFRYS